MDKLPLTEPFASPSKDIKGYVEKLLQWIQTVIYYKIAKRVNWLIDRVYDTPQSFTDGDTTPSVLGRTVFTTASTGATSITDFDDGVAGQRITIIGADSGNTTLVDGTLLLAGNFVLGDGDTIQLVYHTAWSELSRSNN